MRTITGYCPLNILKCKTVFFRRNINKNYTYSVQGTQLERLEHIKDLGGDIR